MSGSGFFVSDDKIPITQQSIGIPSENGLSYNSTQTIEIQVPPTTKFVNPKDSVLQFNVKITPDSSANNTRLQLDADIGAQVLIKDIRIYDGNRNTLLEEITDYNTMVAMKYDYETNQSLRNKRGLTEGTIVGREESRGSRGSTFSDTDLLTNPYFQPAEGDQTDSFDASKYVSAKVNLPLHTGLFQNDKILPIMLLDGLHISITLEDDARVFRQMDNALKGRRTTYNPIFHSTNGSATTGVLDDGSATTTWFLQTENNQIAVDNCPFVVGETINFYDTSSNTTASFTGSAAPKISSISSSTVGGTEFVVLTTQSVTNATGETIKTGGQWIVYSTSVELATSYSATYQVSNVELILQEVMMPSNYESSMLAKMKEGGSLSYDFLSATNYRYSQLVSDRVANIRIPIENSRCKSILCVPTDSNVYTQNQAIVGDTATPTYKVFHNDTRDFRFHSGRSGLVGCADHISSYNFVYDGRLQPSRAVSCSKTGNKVSIAGQPLIELDKALSSAGINTHSMRKYNENFVIGRALALGSGVYDARNKDFNLQVNYQETNAPSVPKLWKNYVFHLRRLVIKGDSILVEI